MQISKAKIANFRGIKNCEVFFEGHTVMVGDNNVGKSTILEAIDLTLGPDRLSRNSIIDEHDFYAGDYLIDDQTINIEIEVVITDLSDEQKRMFGGNTEFWDKNNKCILSEGECKKTDNENVVNALRVKFIGNYDSDEDDFIGQTYYSHPLSDDVTLQKFTKKDKRSCGFLYLRTVRTGSRALSLERGSLLDIILKMMELRPKMWEDILYQLRGVSVAEKPELGISEVLTNVQSAVQGIVPVDWAESPKLRVSDLTREQLRRVLTFFLNTGAKSHDGSSHSAPFQHQGTGTINTLVLALLSMIAELKNNVIFAMEEPEISIPPYTQKSLIANVKEKSAQAIFTSHSPYVIEEFSLSNVLVLHKDASGTVKGLTAESPVKMKSYRDEFRKRFCEGLLSKNILILEGRTEYDVYQTCFRKLVKLHPENYKNLGLLSLAPINADGDGNIPEIGMFFKSLGKRVFSIFDKQDDASLESIKNNVDFYFMIEEKGIEAFIVNNVSYGVLEKYSDNIEASGEWSNHIVPKPSDCTTEAELRKTMFTFFKHKKGSGELSELIFTCSTKEEMPSRIIEIIDSITQEILQ